jgi:DNA-binding MarR family transcriptional regulator
MKNKLPVPLSRAQCLTVKAECTASNLRRATRAIGRVYDRAIAPAGLKETQFNVLIGLFLAGEVPLLRLAEELGLDRTTLTRNLGPLERDGLVSSAPGKDQRVRLLRLTEEGRRVLQRAYPLWEEAQRKVVAALGETAWKKLLRGLQATRQLRGQS